MNKDHFLSHLSWKWNNRRKCFMGRPVCPSSMFRISNNTRGKESKLQFYFASTLNPSLGSRDSTSFLYTHVSQKWILKLNSGTHVQWQVLTDQSAGQTAGGARRMPLQTNQKSGFGLTESITRVQDCLCTVKARHTDWWTDSRSPSQGST